MKKALPLALLAAFALAGCSGEPPASKADEQGFKNPSKTPPGGFQTAPPASGPAPTGG